MQPHDVVTARRAICNSMIIVASLLLGVTDTLTLFW